LYINGHYALAFIRILSVVLNILSYFFYRIGRIGAAAI